MTNRMIRQLISTALVLVMLIGFLPTAGFPVQAEALTWNDSATMTLTSEGQEVLPSSVVETADTKLKVYTVCSDKDYTLKTSADNDYAVVFDVQWMQTGEDEYGNSIYDEDLDLELDNVNIRTYNPRQTVFTDGFAAVSFDSSGDMKRRVNLILTGENTVQLLGVQNDTENDNWSAVRFGNCNPTIKGTGTLNAKVAYKDAVGQVSVVSSINYLTMDETVTVNAEADTGAAQGDGITVNNNGISTAAGTTLNIAASRSGIVFTGTTNSYLIVNGELNIKAADHGIDWQAYGMILGDGAKMTVTGLSEGTAPKVGVLTTRGVTIGANCTVKVDALQEAFSNKASNANSNYSAPVSVGENSVVTVSGAAEPGVYAVDCGVKSAHNSYWANSSYPASSLELAAGAEMTINAKYLALQAYKVDVAADAALRVTTTEVVPSSNAYEYTPVYIYSSDTYIREGATLEIDTAAHHAIHGYATLNFLSDDIFIKSAGVAISGPSITRGEGIVTLESEDSQLWRPFSQDSKMAYLTTHQVENHQCYNETFTPVADTQTHTMTCLYCGKETSLNCEWDYGAWSDTSAGILRFRCKLCKQEKFVNVAYHTHVYETWTPVAGQVSPQHESRCTYPGCGAGDYDYCSGYYGAEYHANLTTMRKDCTMCGQYITWEIEGAETAYMEAKEGDCSTPGNVEFWNCGHCNQYYADENCTQKLSPVDAFTTPVPHSYNAEGVCTVCGDKVQVLPFQQIDGSVYSNHGYYFVLVGKTADGKMYAMGNATVDGKRAGVEISGSQVDENGILTVSSEDAEYLLWDNMKDAFVVDGGCLSLIDGRIFVYNTERKGDENLPLPGSFQPYDYSDGSGLGHMYAYFNGKYAEREYLVFNAETLTFEVSDTQTDSLYLYVQLCDHPDMFHNREAKATCTQQGSREYWYCSKCETYYSNAEGTALLEIPEYVNPQGFLTIPAKGHSFGADNKCVNCGMDKPVYAPVTSLEQFDTLGKDAYYLIVFRDGDKTYAAAMAPQNHYWEDRDGDGVFDLFAVDKNGNGVPDCIENVDLDENGTPDYLEDPTGDEVAGTQDDYMYLYEQLAYAADEATYNAPNFTEVTLADDGTITLGDELAMQVQMMEAGIWGGQPSNPEDAGEFGIQETERIRAYWIPNYWVGNSGNLSLYGPEQFQMQDRFYGDHACPGITDMKNWKISFRDDGTVCMVGAWSEYDDTAALQLVKYVNDMGEAAMTIFGAPEMEWEYSSVYSTMTEALPAYLYAATPAGAHTCVWSEWTADQNGKTHTRVCTDETCDLFETAEHNWNAGEFKEPTCTEAGGVTYTCVDCKATYVEAIAPAGHAYVEHAACVPSCEKIGWNAYRTCENCDYTTYEEIPATGHRWSDWTPVDQETYQRQCGGCQTTETMVIPQDKPVNTSPSTNAAGTNLNNSSMELIDSVLTEEEQSAVAAGAEVSIYLVVEDITEVVPAEDKAAAEEKAGDGEIGMYLDIDLFKKVETTENQVTETSNQVEITITIPEELRNTDAAVKRSYQIIRVHDDGNGNLITDVIEGEFNPADNTFTFETDKFSTYALVYTDVTVQGVAGDINCDSQVNNDDVVLLLWHTLFPEEYPITVSGDLTKDAQVNNDDVVLLLWHTLFPEEYPLG